MTAVLFLLMNHIRFVLSVISSRRETGREEHTVNDTAAGMAKELYITAQTAITLINPPSKRECP
jgi:hypothetical protein